MDAKKIIRELLKELSLEDLKVISKEIQLNGLEEKSKITMIFISKAFDSMLFNNLQEIVCVFIPELTIELSERFGKTAEKVLHEIKK